MVSTTAYGFVPSGRGRPRRRGYMLVLVVMMLFGLLGLAALVIDLGLARVTQAEMQTAVDSAALEGLRNGRPQASLIVGEMFSDSTDSGGQTVQYGAGPVVDFSGGVGDPSLAAGQLMQTGNPPVYQPTTSDGTTGLELNLSNATEGDMTSGTYGVNSNYDTTITADEDANYNRRDFVPSLSASTAFLVRMRRTDNPNRLDQEAGTSSSGPPLPVLFGRGSMMARSGTTASELSVSSGVTVRATAIAGPQPAKTVGPLYTNSGGTVTASPQLAPFAIRSDIWAELAAAGGTASVTVDPLAANSGAVVLDSQFRINLTAIGQPLITSANESAMSSGPQPTSAYVPIYADYGSQAATIVGFVYYANWSFQGGVLTLMPAAATVQIGTQNVSPTMALALPTALTATDAALMFQAHATLFSQYPLYAAALVNRYLGPDAQ